MGTRQGFQDLPTGIYPSFFRALCAEASTGGLHSYKSVGASLARHVANQMDDPALEELEALLSSDDDAGVLDWAEHYLPRCIAAVPKPKRAALIAGMVEAWNEDGVR
jgi:hypothetical protein